MHADYFSPVHARIRILNNSIEFYNPGGLPKSISELKDKDLSIPRNPVLSKLFRMVKLAENVGFGTDKIESNWMQYNGSIPAYTLVLDSVICRFALVSNSITEQVLFLIQVMAAEYYAAVELKTLVGIKHQPSFLYNYLQPALALKLIEISEPDSPKSPKQKYRLTQKGIQFKKQMS
jgi:hypothetical protein